MQMKMLDNCKNCHKSYRECFPEVQEPNGSIAIRKTKCEAVEDGMHEFVVGRK